MIFSAVPLRVFSRLWSHAEHRVLRRASPVAALRVRHGWDVRDHHATRRPRRCRPAQW